MLKLHYGHAFDFFLHNKYLKDKNKFSMFHTKVEEEANEKCPTGKKKAKQVEVDAKLVKVVMSEVVLGEAIPLPSSTSTGTNDWIGDLLHNISNVISNVGTAVLDNMHAEQDMHLAQALDTPDRKVYAKEQMALHIMEMHNKQHKLEKDHVLSPDSTSEDNSTISLLD